MLKSRGSVYCPRVPQFGHGDVGQVVLGRRLAGALDVLLGELVGAEALVAVRHSTSGSWNTSTWPDATHTWRGRITELSRPTTSSRPVTIDFHHWRLMFSLSSTPSGP